PYDQITGLHGLSGFA
nr:pedal peptide:ISOTYPE=PLS [Tritonia tetraquetra]